MTTINTFDQLQAALADHETDIVVHGSITCLHSILLPENAVLRGEAGHLSMLSFNHGDGIGLSAGNTVSDLVIQAPQASRAVFTTLSRADLGTFTLNNLTVTGQVSLIFRSGTMNASVALRNLDIVSCDARAHSEQPQKYGVNVYQGALTVYNFNGNPDSRITLIADNITIGRPNAPVIGSGIFVSGFGDNGGWVDLDHLTTQAVYSNGMLPFGCADIITAGVFIVYGVNAGLVEHHGDVVTYGVNDMVLDAWGKVKKWEAHERILSYGPSGIGFVNFGEVDEFIAHKELITYDLGARGYNQYDGTVGRITFHSITTYGDGSIGVQISKPIGTLHVKGDITTHGSVGDTLVKGVVMRLPANALSVKPGGSAKEIVVDGSIVTEGAQVTSYENEGSVGQMTVKGGIAAHGQGSAARK